MVIEDSGGGRGSVPKSFKDKYGPKLEFQGSRRVQKEGKKDPWGKYG